MCPENEDDWESVEMTNILPDYATKKCLEKIAVYCTNRGCAEKMPWKLLEQHLEECPFRQQSERASAVVEERIAVLEKKWRRMEIALGQLCIELRTATQENQKKITELAESEVSFDGTLAWKISHYAKKKATERILYSRPFYTDRFGYKLSLICYPNGDGMGKSTPLSLFLVIMRGEFDDILRWPLQARVRFEAITRQADKIIDVFTTDPTSKSLARPTSESNLGAGCPLFVDKERLESLCMPKSNLSTNQPCYDERKEPAADDRFPTTQQSNIHRLFHLFGGVIMREDFTALLPNVQAHIAPRDHIPRPTCSLSLEQTSEIQDVTAMLLHDCTALGEEAPFSPRCAQHEHKRLRIGVLKIFPF